MRVLTLNMELRKHVDRVIPFLLRERPDIICLQETFEDIVQDLAARLGSEYVFQPRLKRHDSPTEEGIAIMSRFPIRAHRFEVYEQAQVVNPHMKEHHEGLITSGILFAELEAGERTVIIGTTHFTWSPMGQVNDYQRQAFAKMMKILESYDELILCGDFNTPRGQELYDELAKRFQENIPAGEKTTVDPNLHRVKNLELVVDGVFTTENYKVIGTKLFDGLSDHKAIEATIA